MKPIQGRIRTLYWRIFFSVYYFAYEKGERDAPQINAVSSLTLMLVIYGMCVLNLVYYFLKDYIPYGVVIVCVALIVSILNIYYSCMYKGGYLKRKRTYDYLATRENGSLRLKYIVISNSVSIIILMITYAMHNPSVRGIIINSVLND